MPQRLFFSPPASLNLVWLLRSQGNMWVDVEVGVFQELRLCGTACVCVYTHPWGLSMFCCPAFLSNELLYEANICGRWFLSHVQTRPSFPHFSIFLFLHSYYKSAIWYWGQLCQTSAPHRSSKENNPSNAPWRKLACVTMMSALGGCFFSAAT